MNKLEVISEALKEMMEHCEQEEIFQAKNRRGLPSREMVIDILSELRQAVFPGYFGRDNGSGLQQDYYVAYRLTRVYKQLKEQIKIALIYQEGDDPSVEERMEQKAAVIGQSFIRALPGIQKLLRKDVEAGFNGDPAAKSREEVVFSYPGMLAIYVYRIAHELYLQKVPFIPRIMTEYAHGETGIDINPGAEIGEYFFIDHGTGVVIGETTVIGDNVKIYQGVTLGALSTRSGQQLAGVKRHPTIGNNVTIYSNSTVLGGETVIGDNAIIAGNTFITESIPADTKVSSKNPELVIKKPRTMESTSVWDWDN